MRRWVNWCPCGGDGDDDDGDEDDADEDGDGDGDHVYVWGDKMGETMSWWEVRDGGRVGAKSISCQHLPANPRGQVTNEMFSGVQGLNNWTYPFWMDLSSL